MQSFIDVVLPPLLLLGGVALVTVLLGVWVLGRLRLYKVQRDKITIDRKSLTSATNLVADIINTSFDADVKDKALKAYEALGNLKESSRDD